MKTIQMISIKSPVAPELPKRLTMVISSLSPGGAERIMSVMANYWEEKGLEVTLITLDSRCSDFYFLRPGVGRIALGAMGDSRGPARALMNNAVRIRKLRRAIVSSGPDFVISFMEKTNVLTLLATRGLDLKVIVSERIDPSRQETGQVWSRLRRICYPWAGSIVAQTGRAGKWLEVHIRKGTVAIIPNPVVLSDDKKNGVSLADVLPPSPASLTVAAMGRLHRQKGFDLLIRAFAEVAPAFPAWRLVILGEGEERRMLERLAEGMSVGNRVFLPGIVRNPSGVFGQVDLFVLSSRYEGFPNVLLEAMACGLPVISFDCPSGPREIIRDAVDGKLVPAERVDVLAQAMRKMMSDEAERRRLSARAAEVRERFALQKIMGMWEELFTRETMTV